MMGRFTESTVESAVLAWLSHFGWQVGHGSEIVPDRLFAEWQNYGQVSLEQRLRDAFSLKIMHSHVWVGDKAQVMRITL
jgi:hypothetical protein